MTRPTVILFLVSDTGGGHRRAAQAVAGALARRDPGRFRPVIADPLTGPGASRWLRALARSYGPVIRHAPWLWGAAYHATNSRLAARVLGRTAFGSARRAATAAALATEPAVVVNCHPLTNAAATAAAAGLATVRQSAAPPVITVVTDLATAHASWFCPAGGLVVAPTAAIAERAASSGVPAVSCWLTGLPVATADLPAGAGQAGLRRDLGLAPDRFTIVLTGGGEGCGQLGRRAAAILRRFPDAQVVVLCGRNRRLLRRLSRRAARTQAEGRLIALGFTEAVRSWLACADVVVTKAGPASISEAASCGVPMLLTTQLPGQERGNAAFAEQAGAGRPARTVGRMLRQLGELRADPAALAAMRAASLGLARPDAAADVAALIATAAVDAAALESAAGPCATGRAGLAATASMS